MLKIKYEYFCDKCGKQMYLNSKKKKNLHIVNDEETPMGDGLNYSCYIKEWDLCEDCFKEFDFDSERALRYLKENK